MNELKRCWSLALIVTAMMACNANIVGSASSGTAGSGTAGSGGGPTCPPPSPGLCSPTTACVNGSRQTGEATCEKGQWVCATTPCSECGPTPIHSCVNGTIVSSCCEPGVWCDAPPNYCDLGNGTCADSPCDAGPGGGPDGGAACSSGTIVAADYDQSCATDGDCAPVFQGSLCSQCFCPNAAINHTALSAYEAVITAHASGPGCGCPVIPSPVCSAGVCAYP